MRTDAGVGEGGKEAVAGFEPKRCEVSTPLQTMPDASAA